MALEDYSHLSPQELEQVLQTNAAATAVRSAESIVFREDLRARAEQKQTQIMGALAIYRAESTVRDAYKTLFGLAAIEGF